MAPINNTPTYSKDERVLCFHHELLYEAKVLDSRPVIQDPPLLLPNTTSATAAAAAANPISSSSSSTSTSVTTTTTTTTTSSSTVNAPSSTTTDKKPAITGGSTVLEYLVHYKGWKKSWDDWVPHERLRKFTDENKQLAQTLKREMESARRQSSKDTTTKKAGPGGSRKKAAGSDFSSTRGSEERQSSAQAPGSTVPASTAARGQKRGRDNEVEKVSETTGSARSTPAPAPAGPPAKKRRGGKAPAALKRVPKQRLSTVVEDEEAGETGSGKAPSPEPVPARPTRASTRVRAPTRKAAERGSAPPTRGRGSGTGRQATRPTAAKRVVGRNPVDDVRVLSQEEQFLLRPAVRLAIPENLKGMLVDDWEYVTKNLQLVPLPSANPVNSILRDYLREEAPRRRPGSAEADLLAEVVSGLGEYFDKSLGRILLYRFEREQFSEMREKWEGAGRGNGPRDIKGPGDVYGAEHLARLLVSMPELIAETNMDPMAVSRLRQELQKITLWLAKNSDKYFIDDYVNASAEYVERARGE